MAQYFHSYPANKPSGVERLGDVPAHWKIRRIRTVAEMRVSNVDKHTKEGEFPVRLCNYADVYKNDRITPAMPFMYATASQDEIERFHLEKGDVLITKDSETWDDIGVPALVAESADNLVSGYHLALLRPFSEALGAYLAWTLQSKAVAYQFHVRANGVTRYGLTHTGIQSVRIPLPSLPEQAAIVRFLDHADGRIRRYIRAKQKLIPLLEEQKQAIIHQAVTGQINVRTGQPYPAYKDSGVEWLGDVPEHWQLLRLKDVAQVQTGLTLGKDYRSTRTISRPYLRVANVQAGCLDLTHVKSIDVPQDEAARTTLLTGDVLMTEGGDIDKLGRGCVWRNEIPGCLHQNHVFAVRCGGLLSPEFLVGLMGSIHGRAYFEFTAKQTTNLASTNSSTLRKFPVLLPVLEEQAAILNVISEETNALDNAIGRAKREIDLIQEYRNRLIADVVTGKLDVREAAAELSDQGNETEPRDESDDVTDKANIPDWTWAARNGRRTNRK